MTKTTGQFPKRRESEAQEEKRVTTGLRRRFTDWRGDTHTEQITPVSKNKGNGRNRDKSKYGEANGPQPAQSTQVGDSTN